MNLHTINLIDQQLNEVLDPQTISVLCQLICQHIIGHLSIPFVYPSTGYRATQDFLAVTRSRFGVLERMATQGGNTYVPHIHMKCVSIITRKSNHRGGRDIISISAFDLTKESMSQVSNDELFSFLCYIIEIGLKGIRNFLCHEGRLVFFADWCMNVFKDMASNLDPIVNQVQPWPRNGRPRIVSAEIQLEVEQHPIEHQYDNSRVG